MNLMNLMSKENEHTSHVVRKCNLKMEHKVFNGKWKHALDDQLNSKGNKKYRPISKFYIVNIRKVNSL